MEYLNSLCDWASQSRRLNRRILTKKKKGVYQLSYLGGSSTEMSLNALRESVYHFFYAESGYSYNARYLDKLSLFWEWQRQLCAHFLCIPQNMPFWLNGFAGAEEMQTTTPTRHTVRIFAFIVQSVLRKYWSEMVIDISILEEIYIYFFFKVRRR